LGFPWKTVVYRSRPFPSCPLVAPGKLFRSWVGHHPPGQWGVGKAGPLQGTGVGGGQGGPYHGGPLIPPDPPTTSHGGPPSAYKGLDPRAYYILPSPTRRESGQKNAPRDRKGPPAGPTRADQGAQRAGPGEVSLRPPRPAPRKKHRKGAAARPGPGARPVAMGERSWALPRPTSPAPVEKMGKKIEGTSPQGENPWVPLVRRPPGPLCKPSDWDPNGAQGCPAARSAPRPFRGSSFKPARTLGPNFPLQAPRFPHPGGECLGRREIGGTKTSRVVRPA